MGNGRESEHCTVESIQSGTCNGDHVIWACQAFIQNFKAGGGGGGGVGQVKGHISLEMFWKYPTNGKIPRDYSSHLKLHLIRSNRANY